jgi:hypothetical protein
VFDGVGDACMANVIVSGQGGSSLEVPFDGNCVTIEDACDDLDADGICDDVDDCVGEYDECGTCNGDGIADGACDCDGNVEDCAGACLPGSLISWQGDGYCDDGTYGVDFVSCGDYNCDNGDCGTELVDGECVSSCAFFDCAGQCADGYESWQGDGFCDGTDMAYGLDFSCYDCDSGDCNDECGVCEGSGIADGACDCDGNVDAGCGCGQAGPSGCDNACGICGGGNASMDECGLCDGDGSSCVYNPTQSMEQAVYYFDHASIDGEELSSTDWIIAMNGDILVGASAYEKTTGDVVEVVVMGEESINVAGWTCDSGPVNTCGMMSSGETPQFYVFESGVGEHLAHYMTSDGISLQNIPATLIDSSPITTTSTTSPVVFSYADAPTRISPFMAIIQSVDESSSPSIEA